MVGLAGLDERVGVGRVRHGEHVATEMVERLERPVRTGGAVHEVAERTLDQRPVQPDQPGPRLRDQVLRRRQLADPGEPLVAGQSDALLPVLARAALSHHGPLTCKRFL